MTIEIDDIETLNAQPVIEWRPGQRNAAPINDPDEWIEDINRRALLEGGYEL